MDEAVTPFSELLDRVPGLSASEMQVRSSRLLPGRVRDSALGWWVPTDPLPTAENMLMIGAAVWSGYDMNTLDHVDEAVRQGTAPELDVFVFDADAFQTQEQIQAVFTDIGSIHHTPIVGLWRGGRLVETACGYHGRLVIARALNISDEPLHYSRPTAVNRV